MTTISINYELKDLFNDDDWEEIEEEFTCPICLELIYNKQWYQCSQGHASCRKCWSSIISSGTKCCPVCRVPIRSLSVGLSRCRFIEQSFHSKIIRCPNYYKEDVVLLIHDIENGCNDIIRIEELEEHLKICNSRLVKCNNDGCDKVSRYNQYSEHEKECGYAVIQCELCDTKVKRLNLINHKETICKSKAITCTDFTNSSLVDIEEQIKIELSCNNQIIRTSSPRIVKCLDCETKIMKCYLDDHIKNQCPNSNINCKFSEYGCKHIMKRSELSEHLEKINHIDLILNYINYQSQQINEYKEEIIQNNNKYNSVITILKDELEKSKIKYQELTNQQNITYIPKNKVAYGNKWVIYNFLSKAKDNQKISSQKYYSFPYVFKLSTENNDNDQRFYLHIYGSIKDSVRIKFKVILLNSKNSSRNIEKVFTADYEINGKGYGGGFKTVLYNKESGYIFPDGSVRIDFQIDSDF